MSQLEIGFLFLVIGAFGSCVAAATVFAFFIFGRVGDIASRVTAIETKLDDWSGMFEKFGKKAIDLMHSPHTPELDALIEKVRSSTATDADWLRMLQMFIEMEKDVSLPKSERAMAWFCVIQCKVHLKIPVDPQPHQHSETTT